MDTVRRGFNARDPIEFGAKALPELSTAAQELCFLLDRGYGIKSASAFTGNHHLLSERQRLALARTVSPSAALAARREKELSQPPEELVLDGFNTIITLEVALSGSLLLEGMDGAIRDLAGLRGTYRIVDKTILAADLLLDRLEALSVKRARFYLDRQVSNSGRLRALLLEKAAERSIEAEAVLHPSVDSELSRMENVVTADAIILDRCGSWYNLNGPLIRERVKAAWIVRLWQAREDQKSL